MSRAPPTRAARSACHRAPDGAQRVPAGACFRCSSLRASRALVYASPATSPSSRGPGRWPFKPVTRVRIPSGTQASCLERQGLSKQFSAPLSFFYAGKPIAPSAVLAAAKAVAQAGGRDPRETPPSRSSPAARGWSPQSSARLLRASDCSDRTVRSSSKGEARRWSAVDKRAAVGSSTRSDVCARGWRSTPRAPPSSRRAPHVRPRSCNSDSS